MNIVIQCDDKKIETRPALVKLLQAAAETAKTMPTAKVTHYLQATVVVRDAKGTELGKMGFLED